MAGRVHVGDVEHLPVRPGSLDLSCTRPQSFHPALIYLRRAALFGIAVIGGLLFIDPASAGCVNTSTGVTITGTTAAQGQPVAGEAVVCDATAPNPFPFGIVPTTGQANITVTIGTGAIINAPGSGVLLGDTSTIVNNGTVNTTTTNGFGLSKQFMGSITNNGAVSTSGDTAHGLRSLGGFGTTTNNGTVTVSGPGASGIFTSVNETIANTGTIGVSGSGGNGVFMLGGSSFTNTASGTVTTSSGTAVLGSGSNFRVSSAGVITGGNGTAIQLIGGANFIDVTGGAISGDVLTGAGVDTFTWDGGGTIAGQIVLGEGGDVATLRDLTDANLASTSSTDGGMGSDTLTWENVQAQHPDRFVNWEEFSLLAGSVLTMGGNLVLGDAGTGTGTLTIDGTSTIVASEGQFTIEPAVSGQNTLVTNAGTIDLTNGGDSVTDTLTIIGNYHGDNGALLLNTFLAGDGAPSDRLIVTENETGITSIFVTNVGGPGALTQADGILVDQDINGVSNGAFVLGNVVAAGPYEYHLVQGGSEPGTENNWYLVSHATDIDGDGDGDVDGDDDREVDGDGDTAGNGDGDNDGNPDIELPLYQPEVPIHFAVPGIGRALTLATLGTFHEREGEQAWSRRDGGFEAAWLRTFGVLQEQSWNGATDTTFDGNLWGFQAGLPVHLIEHENGQRDVFGLFAGYGRASGDVEGFALAIPDLDVGHLDMNGYSVGGYWTHHWPNAAYIDTVLMYSWLDAEARSNRRLEDDFDGTEFTASVEAGMPFDLSQAWQIEPQAQLILQHQNFDGSKQEFSTISFDDVDAVTGRLGGRLVGDYMVNDVPLRPFAKANIWHVFAGDDAITYDTVTLTQEREATSLEVGLGLTAELNASTGIYADLDYTTGLGSTDLETWKGRLGFRARW